MLTRDHPSAVLRVAHCLRDIGYGKKSRLEDLDEVVSSADPQFQILFRTAFWIK
jgi:hypothetical protein